MQISVQNLTNLQWLTLLFSPSDGTQFILDTWRDLHWVSQIPDIMRMHLLVDYGDSHN